MSSLIRAGAALAFLSLASHASQAESEFDSGIRLLRQVGFDDLAEKHHATMKASSSPRGRNAAFAGLADVLRLRAEEADEAGRIEEAELIYAASLALFARALGGPIDANVADAAHYAAHEIEGKRIKHLLAATATEPDERKRDSMRRRLHEIMASAHTRLANNARFARGEYDSAPDRPARRKTDLLERAFAATQRRYISILENAQLLQEGTAYRKHTLEQTIASLNEDLDYYWAHGGAGGIVLWLEYTVGRAHAAGGEYQKACEEGLDLVISEDTDGHTRGAKRYIDDLRISSYYAKAKCALEVKRHEEVVAVVDALFADYPDALADDRGNAARLFQAESLALMQKPDIARAFGICQEVIENDFGGWPANAGRILAPLLGEGSDLPADPKVLHLAARGMYQLALRAEENPLRRAKMEESIRLYERTIEACREPNTTYAVVLDHEMASLFEMGICYSRLDLWYEASLAFGSVVRRFPKEAVGRELSRRAEFKAQRAKLSPADSHQTAASSYVTLYAQMAQHEAMKPLLEGHESRLMKSAKNYTLTSRRRMAETDWSFDREQYMRAVALTVKVNPSSNSKLTFHVAITRISQAEDLYAEGKAEEAIAAWIDAAEQFTISATGNDELLEAAIHMAAKSYYRAMAVAASVSAISTQNTERIVSLASKALDAFTSFENLLAHEAVQPRVLEARPRRIRETLLALPLIHSALGNLPKAVESAETYLTSAPQDDESVPPVMWVRFKALCALALTTIDTEGELAAFRKVQSSAESLIDQDRFAAASCSLASATYTNAAKALGTLATTAQHRSRSRTYAKLAASWQDRLLETDERGLDDLPFALSVAGKLQLHGAHDSASALYGRILQRHDPHGRGIQTDLATDIIETAEAKVVFDSERSTDLARARIRSLAASVFGSAPTDRVVGTTDGVNWSRAIAVCEELLEAHPSIQCRDELQLVRDELKYRIRILSARVGLAESNMHVARSDSEAHSERVRGLLEIASHQLGAARAYWTRDNELRLLHAECYERLGLNEEADRLYIDIAVSAPKYSDAYYEAQTKRSRMLLRAGKYLSATSFPYTLIETIPEDEWMQHFPDARAFIAEAARMMIEEGLDPPRVPSEDMVDVIYDVVSANDRWLIDELNSIERRIKVGDEATQDRPSLQRNAIAVHFRRLLVNAVESPVSEAMAGNIARKEVRCLQRHLLAALVYRSPFKSNKLKELAARLDAVESGDAPIPLASVPSLILEKAQELGLLGKDAELLPAEQLPPGTL